MLPPGFALAPDAVTADEEAALLAECEAAGWDFALRRATRQYGFRYDFRGGLPGAAPPLPAFALGALAAARAPFPDCFAEAAQCIVNRYLPGEGIAYHTDDRRLFGPQVLVLSLGSDTVVNFRLPGSAAVPVPVPRRSAYLMEGPAREAWQHEIPARLRDGGVPRGTRVSLTFRTRR